MSLPSCLAHLLPLLDTPDAEFDAIWADLVAGNPDLATPGDLEMPPEALRKMMKLSFLAGKVAIAAQLSAPDSE